MGQYSLRYSEAFKLRVVRELESGRLRSFTEASERYGIGGKSTVSKWVRKYSKSSTQHRVIDVKTPDECSEIDQLRSRIADLERAVIDSKVQETLHKAYFAVVCREYGIQNPEALKKNIAKQLSSTDSNTEFPGKA